MTKEEVLNILEYAKDNNVSQKKACIALGFKPSTNISFFRKKYDLGDKGTNSNYTGHKIRKYEVNDYFFDEPNLLNCYYAGFIAADGNLPNRSQDRGNVTLEISEKDEIILENIKKDLKCESPIRHTVGNKGHYMVSLRFTSHRIREKLGEHFNITPRKSLTLCPPNLNNDELKFAYICGYIDGDGTICLYQRNGFNNINLSILGTKEICEWIKETFSEITNNKGSIMLKPHTNIYKITFTTKSAREIIKKLFVLDVPKLKRKWNDMVFHHCFVYKQQHNHTFKKVNVFDLYGALLKRCESIIEASEYTNVNKGTISKFSIKNSNKCQSNGFMFSTNEAMDKYEPPTDVKLSGLWRKTRNKLIEDRKIKEEDFPFLFDIKKKRQ